MVSVTMNDIKSMLVDGAKLVAAIIGSNIITAILGLLAFLVASMYFKQYLASGFSDFDYIYLTANVPVVYNDLLYTSNLSVYYNIAIMFMSCFICGIFLQKWIKMWSLPKLLFVTTVVALVEILVITGIVDYIDHYSYGVALLMYIVGAGVPVVAFFAGFMLSKKYAKKKVASKEGVS